MASRGLGGSPPLPPPLPPLLLAFAFAFATVGWAFPLRPPSPPETNGDLTFVPDDASTSADGILALFLVAGSVACLVTVVAGCLCCKKERFKGLQNVQNGSVQEGYDNVASNTEFTIFPPAPYHGQGRGSLVDIKFEPLPDIRPRGHGSSSSQPRPANFSNVVNRGLSVQDWFDEPYSNFPRHQLKYLQEVGSGWFGQVVEGEGQGIAGSKKSKVVVKILREDATPTDQIYFLHEVKPFRDLNHPNVLKLLGKCVECDPFLLLFEHCAFKDLRSYLIQHRSEAESLVQENMLLRMVCNIAAGLQHMHAQNFIHTDLAARNCLVDSELRVKIGDYGNSIEKFRDNYYCAGDIAVPIRWCAPESLRCTETTIETKEVTCEANIWSFGVVLWEVMEFGKLPYFDLHDEDVLQSVVIEQSTQLPEPQSNCNHRERIFQVMKLCWLEDPSSRPKMEKLETLLAHLYQHKDSAVDFEKRWNLLQPKASRSTNIIATVESHDAMTFENNFDDGPSREPRKWGRDDASSPSPHPSLNLDFEHAMSPSLQNLRGSLDDMRNPCLLLDRASVSESGLDGNVAASPSTPFSKPALVDGKAKAASLELLRPRAEASSSRKVQKEFDDWILLQQDEGDEASQMAKEISEAMHRLDSSFANEKGSTSSDGNSAKSTPERDVALQQKQQPAGNDDSLTFLMADDATWKEFVGRSALTATPITELVKEKSQSVQDFLKLTVIDSDNSSDSDSLRQDLPPPSGSKGGASESDDALFARHGNDASVFDSFALTVVRAALLQAMAEVTEQQRSLTQSKSDRGVPSSGALTPNSSHVGETNFQDDRRHAFKGEGQDAALTTPPRSSSRTNTVTPGDSVAQSDESLLTFRCKMSLPNLEEEREPQTSFDARNVFTSTPVLTQNETCFSVRDSFLDATQNSGRSLSENDVASKPARELSPIERSSPNGGTNSNEQNLFGDTHGSTEKPDELRDPQRALDESEISSGTKCYDESAGNNAKNDILSEKFNTDGNVSNSTYYTASFGPEEDGEDDKNASDDERSKETCDRNSDKVTVAPDLERDVDDAERADDAGARGDNYNSTARNVDFVDGEERKSRTRESNATVVENDRVNTLSVGAETNVVRSNSESEPPFANVARESTSQDRKSSSGDGSETGGRVSAPVDAYGVACNEETAAEGGPVKLSAGTVEEGKTAVECNQTGGENSAFQTTIDANASSPAPTTGTFETLLAGDALASLSNDFIHRNIKNVYGSDTNDGYGSHLSGQLLCNFRFSSALYARASEIENDLLFDYVADETSALLVCSKFVPSRSAVCRAKQALLSDGVAMGRSDGEECDSYDEGCVLNDDVSVKLASALRDDGFLSTVKEGADVAHGHTSQLHRLYVANMNKLNKLHSATFELDVGTEDLAELACDEKFITYSDTETSSEPEASYDKGDSDFCEKTLTDTSPFSVDADDASLSTQDWPSLRSADNDFAEFFSGDAYERAKSSAAQKEEELGVDRITSSRASFEDFPSLEDSLHVAGSRNIAPIPDWPHESFLFLNDGDEETSPSNNRTKLERISSTDSESSTGSCAFEVGDINAALADLETDDDDASGEIFDRASGLGDAATSGASDASNGLNYRAALFDGDDGAYDDEDEDDVLIVDTETNEARLVEGHGPRPRAGFVGAPSAGLSDGIEFIDDSDCESVKLEATDFERRNDVDCYKMFASQSSAADGSLAAAEERSHASTANYVDDVERPSYALNIANGNYIQFEKPEVADAAEEPVVASDPRRNELEDPNESLDDATNSLATRIDDDLASAPKLAADENENPSRHHCDDGASSSPQKCYTPDWETESDSTSSHEASSTSGEFDCSKNSVNGATKTDGCEGDGADGVAPSFQISSWDKNATPTKSAILSPERKKHQLKKSVSFNTPKQMFVYEYPKEDKMWVEELSPRRCLYAENFSSQVDLQNYADWEFADEEIPEDIIDMDDDASNEDGAPRANSFYRLTTDAFYDLGAFQNENEADDDAEENEAVGEGGVVLYDADQGAFSLHDFLERYGANPFDPSDDKSMPDLYLDELESCAMNPNAAFNYQFLPYLTDHERHNLYDANENGPTDNASHFQHFSSSDGEARATSSADASRSPPSNNKEAREENDQQQGVATSNYLRKSPKLWTKFPDFAGNPELAGLGRSGGGGNAERVNGTATPNATDAASPVHYSPPNHLHHGEDFGTGHQELLI